ncbi:MAG: hypothetical protein ABI806_29035, partial [Candidatus Solibacter sp.]
MSRKLTAATTLENLKYEAKRWLKALRENHPDARQRFERVYPNSTPQPVLRRVQHALAVEYGMESWLALVAALESQPRSPKAQACVQAAQDFVAAYEGDTQALERFNRYYDRELTMADLKAMIWRRVYAFRQRSSRVPKNFLQLDEAQIVVAQDEGFSSWSKLIEAAESGTAAQGAPYSIDPKENRIGPARYMRPTDWDQMLGVLAEQRLAAVDSQGMMTDAVMERIASMEHVTRISLGGSSELTDTGLMQLARMPQLEYLNLSAYPGDNLTDGGLEMLRHLPNLRVFEMTWQRGISDAGIANLRFCRKLERVDLMGSPTGDGAIEALQGMENLRSFSTGRLVTDAGLPMLHNFPRLKIWNQPDGENGSKLLIDGPFSDAGLAGLAGLEGVFELDLFWHVSGITPEGFAHLTGMPNLAMLGADGELSSDAAMRHIAAIPRLRRLRIQESAATDEGFEALSKSQSLESIWGRECPHFGSRGFVALSKMPALRGFGISCKNVDDAALATLPSFPSLRELTPIGFTDAGFRHIGGCRQLERLTCMYCRETGDAATEQIAGLPLKYYYAGLTQITDRSLAILGRMPSLEQIEFYECNGPTDAGLPYLATLPNLKEVHIDSLPGV